MTEAIVLEVVGTGVLIAAVWAYAKLIRYHHLRDVHRPKLELLVDPARKRKPRTAWWDR